MTFYTVPLAIVASALFAYGIIGILIEHSNDKGNDDIELNQFSNDSIQIISEEDNLPIPMPIIDFPSPTVDATQNNTN